MVDADVARGAVWMGGGREGDGEGTTKKRCLWTGPKHGPLKINNNRLAVPK